MESIRAITTGIATEALQKKSHFAAKINLKHRERQFYRPSTAEQILEAAKGPYHKTGCGELPFLLHIGPSKVFVSKSFVPFGTCQRSIGKKLGVSDRTVRRHLEALGLEKRQIVQAKSDYRLMTDAMKNDASFYQPSDDVWLVNCGNTFSLNERLPGTKKWRPSYEVNAERFFEYYGKHWIYRCNLYEEPFKLCSMKAARQHFQKLASPPEGGAVKIGASDLPG